MMNVAIKTDSSLPEYITMNIPGKGNVVLPVIDGRGFDPEIVNALEIAQKTKVAPNLDHLLYGEEEDWIAITNDENYYPRDEYDPISRRAESAALHTNVKQEFHMISLAGSSMWAEKDGVVAQKFNEAGHIIISCMDVNSNAEQNIAALGKMPQTVGERYSQEGDMFLPDTYAPHKNRLEGQDLILTCFGLTFQNLEGKVENYEDAVKALTVKIKALKKAIKSLNPKTARLFVTFDQAKNREDIINAYSGEVHDRLLLGSVERHMGQMVSHGEIERRFVPHSSSLLNRDFVLSRDVAVWLPNDNLLGLEKGVRPWHGKSSKMPEKYIGQSIGSANTPSTTDQPCRDEHERIACYELRLVA